MADPKPPRPPQRPPIRENAPQVEWVPLGEDVLPPRSPSKPPPLPPRAPQSVSGGYKPSDKVLGSRPIVDNRAPAPKAVWSGQPIVPRPPQAPGASHVVWEKTDWGQERDPAPAAPAQPPRMRQAPPPVPPRYERVTGRDSIRVGMRPDELPGVISYYDRQGVRQSVRGQREDWHGAPVVAFPTTVGESLIIGPSLEGAHRQRPEICMDRAAFEYDKEGNLKSFAIADGVSQGLASASVADRLVQIVTKSLVELEARANRLLRKTEVDNLMTYVQAKLREHINLGEMERDFLANTTMHRDFADGIVEDIRKGASIGSSTLIAGMVRKGLYPGTTEMGEHLTMMQIGDGGYVVIGPYARRDTSVFGKFERAGRAPAQIAPGRAKDVPSEDIQVQQVALRRGEILLAVTDGIEKGAWKTLEAFQARAQELFQQGYRDPNQLVRRLLWESNGGSGIWADDTTIFAHQAR